MTLSLTLLTGCFPQKPGPRLGHFATQAPQVGEPAPAFELRDPEGRIVVWSELVGDMPLVLQLGSHSCPVYRYRRHWMNDLMADYAGRVRFVVVYTVEAHPAGYPSPYTDREWRTWINRVTGVKLSEPSTEAERSERAAWSRQRLGLEQQILVDTLANEVWQAYGKASSPAFVVDRRGRIAHRQVWLDPDALRPVLDRLLTAPEASTKSAENP